MCILLSMLRTEPCFFDRPPCSLITIPTELPQFLHSFHVWGFEVLTVMLMKILALWAMTCGLISNFQCFRLFFDYLDPVGRGRKLHQDVCNYYQSIQQHIVEHMNLRSIYFHSLVRCSFVFDINRLHDCYLSLTRMSLTDVQFCHYCLLNWSFIGNSKKSSNHKTIRCALQLSMIFMNQKHESLFAWGCVLILSHKIRDSQCQLWWEMVILFGCLRGDYVHMWVCVYTHTCTHTSM